MNKRIPKIVKRWANNISKRKPKKMISFYSRRAILLATYESMLIGKDEIYGYFVEFLNKENLNCKILENYTQTDYDRDTHIANGLYEFSFNEGGEEKVVLARYTFVVNKDKIITHHSSVNP